MRMKRRVGIAIDRIVNAYCVCHFQKRIAHGGHILQELSAAIVRQIVQARRNGVGQEQRIPRKKLTVTEHNPSRADAADYVLILASAGGLNTFVNECVLRCGH